MEDVEQRSAHLAQVRPAHIRVFMLSSLARRMGSLKHKSKFKLESPSEKENHIQKNNLLQRKKREDS
jgi:hypothetical protein